MISNLEVNVGKIKLKNPIMVASGTFGYAEEFKSLMDLKMLGAIITKTITLKKRAGNPMPRVCETSSGMLNSIGLENDGVENFIDGKIPFLKKLNVPIIVSVSGDSIDEFKALLKILDKERSVSGIELNISCPNIQVARHPPTPRLRRAGMTHDTGLISQNKDATYSLIKGIRKYTNKTFITKLSPNVTDIGEIAKAAESAGSDAISLINTILGMAIDIDTKRPKLGNIVGGLSGPAIKPVALRMVYEVSKSVKIPIIGIGGIMDWQDAIEFLIAGASAIQIGTANFIDPASSEKILKGIEEYLSKNKIKDIKKIIGGLKI
ncbi:MAG: dihydroorotate dehydrogenase [Candidatus Omnitrophota bacterium]